MARITHSKTTPTIGLSDWNADHVIEGVAADDHTHDYAASGHSHPAPDLSGYAATGHSHDTTHSHTAADLGAAETAHTHDTTHDHDGDYSAPHSHPYAASEHVHDYSAPDHTHDTSHTHDLTAYATDADLTAHAATPHGGSPGELYAVGDIYITTRSGNPATLLGYGTWSAYGDGRLLMSGGTAGQTGGSSTHTHAAHSGVINHTHGVTVTDNGHAHAMQRFPTATGGSTGFTVDTSMSGTPANANNTATATTGITATTANPAGGVAELTHDSPSHLPPYITVRVWERTA